MVFGTVQVRSSASPSPRPRWLLVTCSRHSPIPLGLPPSPPPCRSPRSSRWVVCNTEKIYTICYSDFPILPPPYKSQPRSRWVVCKIEKIYNLCYGRLLLLSQRCRSLQSSRFVVWKYNASYRDYRENRVFVIQISLSFPTV